jgi:holin-like protein
MTQAAAVALVLLILGEAIAETFALPIPGSALGLCALAAGFAILGRPDEGSEALFDLVAPYFPFFFVPAAVGVVANLDLLAFAWMHVVAAIVAGTAATITVTGLTVQALLRITSSEASV